MSQGRIERVEEIGFQWQALADHDKKSRSDIAKYRELIAFKEEFGYYNIPEMCANNPSLGCWCGDMRNTYKKVQKGMKTNSKLWQSRIERLEEIGFKWKLERPTKGQQIKYRYTGK